jgi:hypothetical protein
MSLFTLFAGSVLVTIVAGMAAVLQGHVRIGGR